MPKPANLLGFAAGPAAPASRVDVAGERLRPAIRRPRRRGGWRKLALAAGCSVAACMAFAVQARLELPADAIVSGPGFDGLAQSVGLGIAQVQVTGHRYTPDSAIFLALALEQTGSQLSFDGASARIRIEALPWVATAAIQRIFPDGLSITIRERTAYAVWHRPDNDVLVDATGRELGAVAPGHDLALPSVAGDGAGPRAAEILTLVAGHDAIARRLAKAWRIADRRWRLELVGGTRIELPAENAAPALARLVGQTPAPALTALLDGAVASIDLRASEHMVIRRRDSIVRRLASPATGQAGRPARSIAPMAAVKSR